MIMTGGSRLTQTNSRTVMEQARLAVGHRTEKPYRPEKMPNRVYSPEELCYLITLEAYMLDESFASHELADWLGEECGLEELGDRLHAALKRQCTVEEFAREILTYVGFYPEDRIDETCEVIRDNASLGVYEKGKSRAFNSGIAYTLSIALMP